MLSVGSWRTSFPWSLDYPKDGEGRFMSQLFLSSPSSPQKLSCIKLSHWERAGVRAIKIGDLSYGTSRLIKEKPRRRRGRRPGRVPGGVLGRVLKRNADNDEDEDEDNGPVSSPPHFKD